jgi:hypothetical protein
LHALTGTGSFLAFDWSIAPYVNCPCAERRDDAAIGKHLSQTVPPGRSDRRADPEEATVLYRRAVASDDIDVGTEAEERLKALARGA